MFREKNVSSDAQFTTGQDSSLSLIDLETVDRTDIFTTVIILVIIDCYRYTCLRFMTTCDRKT